MSYFCQISVFIQVRCYSLPNHHSVCKLLVQAHRNHICSDAKFEKFETGKQVLTSDASTKKETLTSIYPYIVIHFCLSLHHKDHKDAIHVVKKANTFLL